MTPDFNASIADEIRALPIFKDVNLGDLADVLHGWEDGMDPASLVLILNLLESRTK